MYPLRNRKLRRASSLVETALILPMVLVFIVGAMDVGRGVWCYNVIAEAAREGGRHAIVRGDQSPNPLGPAANDSTVEGVVRSHCVGLEAPRLTVRSSWVNGDNRRGSTVRIQVDYQFVPVVAAIVGRRTVTMSTVSQMVISH